MEANINLALVNEHISINFKSNKFEFKLFHNRKTKYDIDYYPLITPKSSDGIPKGVVKCIANLITQTLNNIKDINKLDVYGIIYADLFSALPKKTYQIWDARNRSLGLIYTSAPEDKITETILTYNSKAAFYLEKE